VLEQNHFKGHWFKQHPQGLSISSTAQLNGQDGGILELALGVVTN